MNCRKISAFWGLRATKPWSLRTRAIAYPDLPKINPEKAVGRLGYQVHFEYGSSFIIGQSRTSRPRIVVHGYRISITISKFPDSLLTNAKKLTTSAIVCGFSCIVVRSFQHSLCPFQWCHWLVWEGFYWNLWHIKFQYGLRKTSHLAVSVFLYVTIGLLTTCPERLNIHLLTNALWIGECANHFAQAQQGFWRSARSFIHAPIQPSIASASAKVWLQTVFWGSASGDRAGLSSDQIHVVEEAKRSVVSGALLLW